MLAKVSYEDQSYLEYNKHGHKQIRIIIIINHHICLIDPLYFTVYLCEVNIAVANLQLQVIQW